jgi:photosystem II stability/assembly factor-like uncharacterized protein
MDFENRSVRSRRFKDETMQNIPAIHPKVNVVRVVRRTVLVIIFGGLSLAVVQLILRTQSRDSQPVQGNPKVEIRSAIPRNETGRYGLGEVAFLDSGEAWAVGYDGKHPQQVYHSRDLGMSWESVNVPGNEWLTLKALSFSDSTHGWAVGGYGLIIRTTDAGRSWQRTTRSGDQDMEAVSFVNPNVGFAGGTKAVRNRITDEVKGSLEILCTKDGGEHWQSCYKENEPGTVFQIATLSESAALVVLDGNRLIRTDDQGATWRPIDLSTNQIASVALAGDGAHWVVGRNGTFERSDDGDRTWRHVTSLTGNTGGKNWRGIAFNATGAGIAVGDGGLLIITLDNGKTWLESDSGIRDDLRAVRLQGDSAIILGVKKVYSIRIVHNSA